MLTDYHLHLRTDDPGAAAGRHFTPDNVARYRAVARERGIAELGVSEHVYRFAQALAVWDHPFWREYAIDDLDAYCEFVRERTDLKLGIEADFVPGREHQMAELLGRGDFDYVVGSVHFLGDRAIDMEGDHSVWRGTSAGARDSGSGPRNGPARGSASGPRNGPARGSAGGPRSGPASSPEAIWRNYFQTLAQAARSGLFDILAHPDLVKVWGPHRPRPAGDLRHCYEIAVEAIAESGIAVEVSTAGLRKPARELYPAEPFLRMCVEAGAPVALSSDAHRPEDVGADYGQALELLERVGVRELCVFERRSRRLEPIGAVVT